MTKKFDSEITTLFQKDQTFEISTQEQLLKFIESIFLNEDIFFYRGIDKGETIIPTLLRLKLKKKDLVEKEYCMIKDLLNNGSLHLLDNSAIDILSTAQHFGLPTRSLDWTNFFKALYFARGDGSNNNNYIYILQASRNENIYLEGLPLVRKNLSVGVINEIKYPNNNILQEDYYHLFEQIKSFFNFKYAKKSVLKNYLNELVEILYPTKNPIRFGQSLNKNNFKAELYNKISQNRIVFIQPNFNNSRISAQNGLFSIATVLNVQNNIKLIKKNCKLIKIKKTSQIEKLIDDILIKIGINAYTMMPDLSNICREIKRKHTR